MTTLQGAKMAKWATKTKIYLQRDVCVLSDAFVLLVFAVVECQLKTSKSHNNTRMDS